MSNAGGQYLSNAAMPAQIAPPAAGRDEREHQDEWGPVRATGSRRGRRPTRPIASWPSWPMLN